ncbi:amino acid ABC transporter ATP-binding protein [uncultured Clostridium sp.]|uniref:amino acid ABC transporter ATP-binding protein n=1 Tax=uncultured Clostridium sp. TaxID=59620 RepID=UPI002602695A|nr:amino acid ABC transporter ATP-binding protein [uncultured Clostridium sp.]
MLEIRNLNKSFKNVTALKDININIAKGDILSIIGESGAGKTTLLRSLTGLEKCNSGTIKIEDTYLLKNNKYCSSKELLTIRKKIGLVFQGFNLFPHMTVLENIIESPIHVHKIKKDEAIADAKKLLLKLGISEKENSYPFELSGGQKQRVAIARALILNPSYICFDEPTSALDPKTTLEVANIIKSLSSDIGVIIITHDMDFAKLISSRIVELADGKIISDTSSNNYWCQKAN